MADIAEIKREFDLDYGAGEQQRDAANRDLRFITVDGGQWEGWMDTEKRTKLEFDMTSPYVHRFISEWGLNKVGVSFEPDDAVVTEEDADLLTGLWLRDYHKDKGVSANNAVFECAGTGYGAFMFSTKDEDDEDLDNDKQDISFRPLYSAYSTVVWDRSAKRQDKSDARYVTVITSYTPEEFKKIWPDASPTSVQVDLHHTGRFTWSSNDLVWVGERYEIKKKKRKAIVYGNPETGEKKSVFKEDVDDIEDELLDDGFVILRERTLHEKQLLKAVYNGEEFLEEPRKIPGRSLPVVPFYAVRGFVDGFEYYYGLVRKLKDSQRVYNLQVSTLTDDAWDTHRDLPIFDPEQVEGLQQHWGGDINKLPYLLAKPLKGPNGEIIQTGPQSFLPSPKVDANLTAMIGVTSAHIERTTGGNLAEVNDPDSSGKAIIEGKKTLDMSTAHVMNGIEIGMRRAGEIYRELAKDVYGEKRTLKIRTPEGQTRMVKLFDEMMDEDTGRMVQTNDVTRGKFEAIVETGPQYSSKREATVETLKEIMTNLAQGSQYEGPVMAMLIDNLDGVGIDGLKEFNRNIMIQQGLVEPETEEEIAAVQAAQGQESDGQAELVAAVTQEQQTQAMVNQTEAQENLANAEESLANTELKRAQAVTEIEGARTDRMKAETDRMKVGQDARTKRIKVLTDALNQGASQRVQALG